jgi:hypothetical protein
MGDGWIDGLLHLPGRQAGGASGVVKRAVDVRHETVGTNFCQIGLNGYFNFRFPKVGPAEQYAEWWAIAWHACEWNSIGVGYECERFPGEPMTENQARWIAYTLGHIQAEAGALPLDWYEGAVYLGGFTGVANHRNLQIRACDPHSDGWTYDEWQWIRSMMGAPPEEDTVKGLLIKNQSDPWVWLFVDGYKMPTTSRAHVDLIAFFGQSSNGPDNVVVLSDAQVASIPVWNPATVPAPPGGGSGASAAQIAVIVEADGNKTRAEVAKPRALQGSVG